MLQVLAHLKKLDRLVAIAANRRALNGDFDQPVTMSNQISLCTSGHILGRSLCYTNTSDKVLYV